MTTSKVTSLGWIKCRNAYQDRQREKDAEGPLPADYLMAPVGPPAKGGEAGAIKPS